MAQFRSVADSSADKPNAPGLRYQTDRSPSSAIARPPAENIPTHRPSRNSASILARCGNHAVSTRATGTSIFQHLDHAVGGEVPFRREDEDRHQSLFQSSELGPSSPSVVDVVSAEGSPMIGSWINGHPAESTAFCCCSS